MPFFLADLPSNDLSSYKVSPRLTHEHVWGTVSMTKIYVYVIVCECVYMVFV